MSSSFTIPQTTLDAQRIASDPNVSAWVAANAGAGKTKVLADRVVRLLLSGTPPARILCLTFTKAAATNMSLRVIKLLGEWVTLSDAKLRETLEKLEGEKVKNSDLAVARRLFARAVETPGGLKIETIHAFCERILHLAPFEAGVPAQFSVVEEATVTDMITQATQTVLATALDMKDADLARAYRIISREASQDRLMEAISAALKYLPDIMSEGGLDTMSSTLRDTLGLYPTDTVSGFQGKLKSEGFSTRQLDEVIAALLLGKITDQKRAQSFEFFKHGQTFEESWEHYCNVFFDAKNEPRSDKSIVTMGVDETIRELLIKERERVTILRDRLRAMEALERTDALFLLSERIHEVFSRIKAQKSALDFDDLIRCTLTLLERGDTAWILYKLDRGIDHILIDEAQDTNPEQWRILRRLSEEFTAGLGAQENKKRTVFAVGDPKQSIYSFQGAAPREFETSRRDWALRAAKAEMPFESVTLSLSFRTAPAVLKAVDATFHVPENYSGLSFDDNAIGTVHESARRYAPGQVELWPVEQAQKTEEPQAGEHPVDAPEPDSAPLLLAKRIAKAIKSWTESGDENGRRWRAGDILILVRKRGTAFEAIIRALKLEGVPVSGQDRLQISEHIAVMDLVSVGRAALLPDDDLSLAEALKSPLVGFADDDLERFAAPRLETDSLKEALHKAALTGDEAAQKGVNALDFWQKLAHEHGPFGFYAALLGYGGARAQLVARLGFEAADAIDAFLAFARHAELSETSSLTSFLTRFEDADHTIKRDLDTQRDEVRVMTVHGAKGLEAPMVIVIDGGDTHGRDPVLLKVPVPHLGIALPLWVPSRQNDSLAIQNFREDLHALALEEHHRLLYVAMTRAKDRLVIAPYARGYASNMNDNAWSSMIHKGFDASGEELLSFVAPYGTVQIWHDTLTKPVYMEPEAGHFTLEDRSPPWLFKFAPIEPEPLPPLRPSLLGTSEYTELKSAHSSSPSARLRGNLIHALLDHLPRIKSERQRQAAHAFISARAPQLPEDERIVIIDQAIHVIQHPLLAPLFDVNAKVEVPISGDILTRQGGVPVSGRIDRLTITEDSVFIADFKSDPNPPKKVEDIRKAHSLQLALYTRLLQQIFPTKIIRAFLVYTVNPTPWELSKEMMDSQLSRYLEQVK